MQDVYTRIRRLAGRILRALPEPIEPQHEFDRSWVQAYGVRTVLDVGANEGQFAMAARRCFPGSRILSFEPIPSCYETLKRNLADDRNFEAIHSGVGEADGSLSFHQNEFSQSSSFLPMKDAHREAFPFTKNDHLIEVSVRTLDGLLKDKTLEEPILLKMDVQGYEAHVLAGGAATLKRCSLVLTEVSLVSLYEGELLAHEMISLLAASGFKIAGQASCLRRPNDDRPLQMDLIFAR